MGNSLICSTDESVLKTPVGECAMKHCGLGCAGKKEEESPEMAQIRALVEAQAAAAKQEMYRQMLAAFQQHGAVLPVQVHDGTTPALTMRSLSVRIKTKDPTPPPTPVEEDLP